MVAGLLIYLSGQRYLPDEPSRAAVTTKRPWFEGFTRDTVIVLLAVALSVMVFRGAYEQVGNSVALWGDSSVDRTIGSFSIPVTWFFSLNPLFVILMTPPLLAYWARRAAAGQDGSPARRMAMGALVVAGSYLILALAASLAGATGAHWLWFAGFFIVFTFGELLILPTGLGLFARLAPQGMGATTVAAWYLTIFSGSIAAGFVGTLSSAMSPELFFVLLAGIAVVAAGLLASLNGRVRQTESMNSGEF